nr:MAG TPA: hypothetical protein [Caudoviricetes sp.]
MGQNTGNSWTCQPGGDKHVLCSINAKNAERCPGNGTDLRRDYDQWGTYCGQFCRRRRGKHRN